MQRSGASLLRRGRRRWCGKEAIARVTDAAFDAVLDLKLPMKNGLEVTEYLAAHHPALLGRTTFTTASVLGC